MSEIDSSYVLHGKIGGIQPLDKTLTKEGAAADAKAAGDMIRAIEEGMGSASAGAVFDHIESKSNPHDVTAAQVGAVPTTRKINNKALSANVTLTADDVGALENSDIFHGTTNGNFNDITVPGIHWMQLASCTNGPIASGFGFLEVITSTNVSTGANDVVQRFTQFNTGAAWTRSNISASSYAGGWRPWVRIDADAVNPSEMLGIGTFTGDINDLDAVPINSVAYITSATTNNPLSGTAILETIGSSTGIRKQTVTSTATRCAQVRYHFGSNAEWTDWEFINPAMTVGKEYATTERYQGKTVYKKCVSLGAFPVNTVKYTNYSAGETITNVLRCEAFMDNGHTLPFDQFVASTHEIMRVSAWASKTSVAVFANYDASSRSGHAIIYYTKD